MRFPEIAESAIVLMDFLADGGPSVIAFVRAVAEQYQRLRPTVLGRLVAMFGDISDVSVMAAALWILGEYCESAELSAAAFDAISESLGAASESSAGNSPSDDATMGAAPAPAHKPTTNSVLADGTYACQAPVRDAGTPAVQPSCSKDNT